MKAGMAAVCFLIKDRQILLMKHHEASFAAGRWSVIGGKLEPDETPDQAVLREVAEETGLTLTEYRHAGHVLQYEADGTVTSLSLFVATACQGEVRGSHEGEPVWWPLEEAGQLHLVGVVRLLLPLVQPPQTLVTGTIRLGADGAPRHWSLVHHTIAESVWLEV